MSNVPTNLIPTRISQLPEAPVADPAGYFPIVISGTTYKVQFSQIQGNVEVPASRRVDTGTGLTGGGSLSANLTIAVANGGIGNDQLDTTGVAAGTYGSSTAIPVVTVNDKGRVTGVSTTGISISGYVPDNRQIVAGTGLAGGGNLSADRTLSIAYSSTIPSALGSPSAGTVENPARADHVHPALNLSDSSQTSGVLPMGRGGTGSAMSPVAGAVVVSNGTNFDLTTVGSSGQVLISNGASLPSWGPAGSLVVDAASRLLGGSANRVVYQSATDQTSFVIAPVAADTFLKWNGSSFEWGAVAGAGTVTSVDGDGGTTGLTVSGGPITAAGTLTLGGTLAISAGGTGLGATATNGQLLIGNGSGYTLATLTAGTAISVTNATGSITLANTAPDQTVTLTDGTAIAVTGAYPSFTVTNTAPDQTVTISGAGLISVSGTYPSFTVGATEGFSGTVTSVDVSGGSTGLTFSGGPVTDSGVITMAGTLSIAAGGTGASTDSGARTALGLGTMAVQDANSVNITGGNVSVGSANITTLTGTTATFTSATVTNLALTSLTLANLSVTSANITTLTGTTFGTTATTQLRGASGQITTLTSTSANITTLTSSSGTVTNLFATTATISSVVLVGTTVNTNGSSIAATGTISEGVGGVQYLVASQYDVGTNPNQIPLNQYLGSMAFQSSAAITVTDITMLGSLTGTIAGGTY